MHVSDDALIAWLDAGAKVLVADDEAAARRHQAFSLRFCAALNPPEDLGPTEELHQLGVARDVYAVHAELNALGEEDYQAVWALLSAPVRRALKAYVAMAAASG